MKSGEIDDEVAERVERRKVVVMRVLIVFFIVISLMIALNPPTFIAQLMGISWGALAGAFLAPFMLGLYWKARHHLQRVGMLCVGRGNHRCQYACRQPHITYQLRCHRYGRRFCGGVHREPPQQADAKVGC